MSTAEWITVASIAIGILMTILSGITSLFCGALLWYMRKESSRADEDRVTANKSISDLAAAATNLTIEIRELQVELKNFREYVHGEIEELVSNHKAMRAEIDIIKDKTRDTWRGES